MDVMSWLIVALLLACTGLYTINLTVLRLNQLLRQVGVLATSDRPSSYPRQDGFMISPILKPSTHAQPQISVG
jgi:hypothetical protein